MKARWQAAVAAVACAWTLGVQAQVSDGVIRIGFITDMSGIYSDYDGPAGAEAIRMAVADMGGSVAGAKVELLVADHKNKADIAASKAREWFDKDKLDMLVAGVNSGAALAMAHVAGKRRNRGLRVLSYANHHSHA